MCLLAKSVLAFAIYDISNPCFGPFVSDICNWFKYPHFCPCKIRLDGAVWGGSWMLFSMYDHVPEN